MISGAPGRGSRLPGHDVIASGDPRCRPSDANTPRRVVPARPPRHPAKAASSTVPLVEAYAIQARHQLETLGYRREDGTVVARREHDGQHQVLHMVGEGQTGPVVRA